jgi:hypothetical protein
VIVSEETDKRIAKALERLADAERRDHRHAYVEAILRDPVDGPAALKALLPKVIENNALLQRLAAPSLNAV